MNDFRRRLSNNILPPLQTSERRFEEFSICESHQSERVWLFYYLEIVVFLERNIDCTILSKFFPIGSW